MVRDATLFACVVRIISIKAGERTTERNHQHRTKLQRCAPKTGACSKGRGAIVADEQH